MKISPLSKIIQPLLVLCLIFSLSGCVYLVIGGIGALGGYVVSPDTVEGVTENTSDNVWEAAIEVISIMGVISEQMKEGGVMIARVDGAKVTITIIPVTDNSNKVTVKARKAFLPKISTAQQVYIKIMSYLNE